MKRTKKIHITRRDKFLGQEAFLQLLQEFIDDSYTGRRMKQNGTKISKGTIGNYEHLQKNILDFVESSTFELKIYVVNNLTQGDKERARRFNQKFYKSFTSYMYDKKKFFDNYVGLNIKCLKSFYNYLERDRNISVGTFHKSFFVPTEEIPIIALTHEQLQHLIFDQEFERKAKDNGLDKVRDIFIFGCTVALRVSDLLSLSKKNLQIQGDNYYIKVVSQKTKTSTSIKLPHYCVEILSKYKSNKSKLLPEISSAWFNTNLKRLGEFIPDNFEMIKTRERRGKQVVVYKDPKKRIHYRLSDHLSTHTMRRTAITTMLCLGMPEHLVRKISGHSANSKEFFRYVLLSQSFIDDETDKIFKKIQGL